MKAKPDPDIFSYAISRLDVEPEEAIFIGDNVEADYRELRTQAYIHW